MSIITPSENVQIEGLIAEADASLERKDAPNLVKQAAAIAKIQNLTAHQKGRITAYYRFLSEDLLSKKSPAASVTPATKQATPPQQTQPLRPSAPPIVPRRTPAAKQPEPIALDMLEEAEDDRHLVENTITADELVDILPEKETVKRTAITPLCKEIVKNCEDKKALVIAVNKLAHIAKSYRVEHYHLKLMLQLLFIRLQLDDETCEKMTDTLDSVSFKNDTDIGG